MTQVDARKMTAHFQRNHWGGKRKADPEPPAHVGEFGIGFRFGDDRQRFQRHAADRAAARADLADRGMHRAGVGSDGRSLVVLGFQIPVRIGCEFSLAASAAEMEGDAAMLEAMARRRRIDRHAADRIGVH